MAKTIENEAAKIGGNAVEMTKLSKVFPKSLKFFIKITQVIHTYLKYEKNCRKAWKILENFIKIVKICSKKN